MAFNKNRSGRSGGQYESRGGGRDSGSKPKTKFNLDNYIEVKDRIEEFVKDHPQGCIQTFIAFQDGPEVVMEARIFRTAEDVVRKAYTSGFAREVEGKGNAMINGTSHLENCETSSVGRALANMAYGVKKGRPSRSEMLKVARMTEDHADMLLWLADQYNAMPEGLTGTIAGEEHVLLEYIADHGEDIKAEFSRCRRVVAAVEAATGEKWGESKAA